MSAGRHAGHGTESEVDMTRQESFKRRVRTRMAKTGERYMESRRRLIERAADDYGWVSEPEHSNEVILDATGKDWDEWRRIIDQGPGREASHTAIVEHVMKAHGVGGWWAQSVAVGYERITGIRLPHQMADGTFTAGKTRTIEVDGDALREMLYDSDSRGDLFPGLTTEMRSKPTAKVPRIGIGPGVAQISIEPKADGRATVTIAHEKLPAPEDVEQWKAYWTEWLEALDVS